MFEGALKLLTNYNPLIHVGSDVILIVTFLRLVSRFYHDENEDLAPHVRVRLNRVVNYLILFWLWVLVQFFNPWGLGFVPSLAGLKVHVIPMLMLFVAGYLLTDEELKTIPPLLLAMGLFQAAFALLDWYLGPEVLPLLHPRYQETLLRFLQGFPYRPFGTTNLPGAPSLWMFHTLVGSVILLHLVSSGALAVSRPKLWNRLFLAFIPLAFGTLVICQVRAAVLRFVLLAVVGLFLLGRRYVGYALFLLALVPAALAFAPKTDFQDLVALRDSGQGMRLQQALARLSTLRDTDAWKKARGGSWVLTTLTERARFSLSGAGLSRFGAAAGPWAHLIARDRYFKKDWVFSDNVFVALFTELGIGGVAAYVLLVGAVLWHLLHVGSKVAYISAAACAIMVASGFGSEGILFQPDASFFWFYAALGLRGPDLKNLAAEGGVA
jgi:hypothetical protein